MLVFAGVYCFLTGHSTLKLLRFSCLEMYGMVKCQLVLLPLRSLFFFALNGWFMHVQLHIMYTLVVELACVVSTAELQGDWS